PRARRTPGPRQRPVAARADALPRPRRHARLARRERPTRLGHGGAARGLVRARDQPGGGGGQAPPLTRGSSPALRRGPWRRTDAPGEGVEADPPRPLPRL